MSNPDTPTPQHQRLPLFPLGTVLFPLGQLPLRIFEVRYLDMIGKCFRNKTPFGVVSLTQGSEVRRPGEAEEFHPIGTTAQVDSLETVQSGLLMVRCTGGERFRIEHSEQLPHGLWTASVLPIAPDQKVPVPPDLAGTAHALERLLETLSQREEAPQFLARGTQLQLDDCGWVSNRWCELLPLAPATKQRLMALDNPLVRLELVSDILTKSGITPST